MKIHQHIALYKIYKPTTLRINAEIVSRHKFFFLFNDGPPSAADVKIEISVLVRSLKSTGFQMDKTFWGVVGAAVEQSRLEANSGLTPESLQTKLIVPHFLYILPRSLSFLTWRFHNFGGCPTEQVPILSKLHKKRRHDEGCENIIYDSFRASKSSSIHTIHTFGQVRVCASIRSLVFVGDIDTASKVRSIPASGLTRRTLSQYRSFKIRHTSFLNYTNSSIHGFWGSKILKGLVEQPRLDALDLKHAHARTQAMTSATAGKRPSTKQLMKAALMHVARIDIWPREVEEPGRPFSQI